MLSRVNRGYDDGYFSLVNSDCCCTIARLPVSTPLLIYSANGLICKNLAPLTLVSARAVARRFMWVSGKWISRFIFPFCLIPLRNSLSPSPMPCAQASHFPLTVCHRFSSQAQHTLRPELHIAILASRCFHAHSINCLCSSFDPGDAVGFGTPSLDPSSVLGQ